MASTTSGAGTQPLTALELFYQDDVSRLAQSLRRSLRRSRDLGLDLPGTVAALRADDFLGLYLLQIHTIPGESWAQRMPVPDGQLRASLFGYEMVAVPRTGRANLLVDGTPFGAERLPKELSGDHRELKALLCYADDVVLEDPFDDEHHALRALDFVRETDPESVALVAPDPDIFVRTVEAIAELARLIEKGVVTFLPRQIGAHPRSVATRGSSIGGLGGDTSRQELAERAARAWLLTGGRAVPFFATSLEEEDFRRAAGLLDPLRPQQESLRLRRLASLALPNSGRLHVRSMAEIRDEDAFIRFRARQRSALALVGAGEDAEARRAYGDEMRAAADEVERHTAHGLLGKFLVPKALGWATGAVMMAPSGWQAILAALGAVTVESVIEAWSERDRAGGRALHHHYVTLAGRHR